MSSHSTGLCAPTTDDWATQVGLAEPGPIKLKVKGAIFKSLNHNEPYFLAHTCGNTRFKERAHVYRCEEIREIMASHKNWASKEDGKWLLVYE